MKKQYGILAYPAKHSFSPILFNEIFKKLRINAKYDYFEINEKSFEKFVKNINKEKINGLAISLPYKEKILKYLDKTDIHSKKIGAVNTLVNKEGILYGYNVDFIGSNKALKEKIKTLKNSLVVVLGAGGAARAVIYGLLKEGVNVCIKNRSKDSAEKIVSDFKKDFNSKIYSEDFNSLTTGDILINTTSIWHKEKNLTPQSLPYFCDIEYLKNFNLVMDISYNVHLKSFKNTLDKVNTPLTLNAKSAGVEVITGEKMLLYQANEQLFLWTGKNVNFEVLEKIFYKKKPHRSGEKI